MAIVWNYTEGPLGTYTPATRTYSTVLRLTPTFTFAAADVLVHVVASRFNGTADRSITMLSSGWTEFGDVITGWQGLAGRSQRVKAWTRPVGPGDETATVDVRFGTSVEPVFNYRALHHYRGSLGFFGSGQAGTVFGGPAVTLSPTAPVRAAFGRVKVQLGSGGGGGADTGDWWFNDAFPVSGSFRPEADPPFTTAAYSIEPLPNPRASVGAMSSIWWSVLAAPLEPPTPPPGVYQGRRLTVVGTGGGIG